MASVSGDVCLIRDEKLLDNARDVGAHFRKGLSGLMTRHALIGDVQWAGKTYRSVLMRKALGSASVEARA